jgi:hypothetical protein
MKALFSGSKTDWPNGQSPSISSVLQTIGPAALVQASFIMWRGVFLMLMH